MQNIFTELSFLLSSSLVLRAAVPYVPFFLVRIPSFKLLLSDSLGIAAAAGDSLEEAGHSLQGAADPGEGHRMVIEEGHQEEHLEGRQQVGHRTVPEEVHHMADQVAVLEEEHHMVEEAAILGVALRTAIEEGLRITAAGEVLHIATIAKVVRHIIAAEAVLHITATAAFLAAFRAVTSWVADRNPSEAAVPSSATVPSLAVGRNPSSPSEVVPSSYLVAASSVAASS